MTVWSGRPHALILTADETSAGHPARRRRYL
jgi:hypothetical protein